MDFDPAWWLLALPVAFAVGWGASRLDLQQLKGERQAGPRAVFRGLSLLLNEQQDKAVDAFIEAVRNDPDAVELHFALGGLFRRRGEFERAIRVHEHLVQRGDLSQYDRDRAQHALAQDFLRAGLFDRAEAAFRSLQSSHFASEAQLALLALHERAREWMRALQVAQALQAAGLGSFSQRMSHYRCELALEADARGDGQGAQQQLQLAREADPNAPRPWVITGERCLKAGDAQAALQAWEALLRVRPECLSLVADAFVSAALACGKGAEALQMLQASQAHSGSARIGAAVARLLREPGLRPQAEANTTEREAAQYLAQQLERWPRLAGARLLLQSDPTLWGEAGLQAMRQTIDQAAQPRMRHRCAGCGFESQRHFWQCPGCLGWDTFPAQTIEEL